VGCSAKGGSEKGPAVVRSPGEVLIVALRDSLRRRKTSNYKGGVKKAEGDANKEDLKKLSR